MGAFGDFSDLTADSPLYVPVEKFVAALKGYYEERNLSLQRFFKRLNSPVLENAPNENTQQQEFTFSSQNLISKFMQLLVPDDVSGKQESRSPAAQGSILKAIFLCEYAKEFVESLFFRFETNAAMQRFSKVDAGLLYLLISSALETGKSKEDCSRILHVRGLSPYTVFLNPNDLNTLFAENCAMLVEEAPHSVSSFTLLITAGAFQVVKGVYDRAPELVSTSYYETVLNHSDDQNTKMATITKTLQSLAVTAPFNQNPQNPESVVSKYLNHICADPMRLIELVHVLPRLQPYLAANLYEMIRTRCDNELTSQAETIPPSALGTILLVYEELLDKSRKTVLACCVTNFSMLHLHDKVQLIEIYIGLLGQKSKSETVIPVSADVLTMLLTDLATSFTSANFRDFGSRITMGRLEGLTAIPTLIQHSKSSQEAAIAYAHILGFIVKFHSSQFHAPNSELNFRIRMLSKVREFLNTLYLNQLSQITAFESTTRGQFVQYSGNITTIIKNNFSAGFLHYKDLREECISLFSLMNNIQEKKCYRNITTDLEEQLVSSLTTALAIKTEALETPAKEIEELLALSEKILKLMSSENVTKYLKALVGRIKFLTLGEPVPIQHGFAASFTTPRETKPAKEELDPKMLFTLLDICVNTKQAHDLLTALFNNASFQELVKKAAWTDEIFMASLGKLQGCEATNELIGQFILMPGKPKLVGVMINTLSKQPDAAKTASIAQEIGDAAQTTSTAACLGKSMREVTLPTRRPATAGLPTRRPTHAAGAKTTAGP